MGAVNRVPAVITVPAGEVIKAVLLGWASVLLWIHDPVVFVGGRSSHIVGIAVTISTQVGLAVAVRKNKK
jgi:hypothetical protein